MRPLPTEMPAPGWLLNGRRYEAEADYLEALRKHDQRRARWMALLERDGWLSREQW